MVDIDVVTEHSRLNELELSDRGVLLLHKLIKGLGEHDLINCEFNQEDVDDFYEVYEAVTCLGDAVEADLGEQRGQ